MMIPGASRADSIDRITRRVGKGAQRRDGEAISFFGMRAVPTRLRHGWHYAPAWTGARLGPRPSGTGPRPAHASSAMTRSERTSNQRSNRLVAVTLDENSIGRSNPDVEHERAVAIYDLLEDNIFAPKDDDGGPFALHLSITGTRLVFDIRHADGAPVVAHLLSLSPLRRIVKDYYMVCDSYYAAIRTATPDRIEALDMGRRALHDEGSNILMERLARKVKLDFDTARRLFTLICVLHWKG